MASTTYYLGGFDANAPAQNRASECDDEARTCTTWDELGNLVGARPYTDEENAAADALTARATLVAVEVDPEAVAAAMAAAQKATSVATLRSAVVALAQQLQPSNGN